MKVTLSLDETASDDVSIMVDALRASTTITVALNNFEKIIPCFTPEEALKLKDEIGGVLAGERNGEKIEGFELENSPTVLGEYESDEKTLILTTSNGTRILEKMKSTVLIGSLLNAKSAALKSAEIAESHIDVVMAGVRGQFALEDFLASGEILYWICQNLDEYEISDLARAAILASRDYDSLKEGFHNCRTGKHLTKLGNRQDVDYCCLKNITDNVGIYDNNKIELLKD